MIFRKLKILSSLFLLTLLCLAFTQRHVIACVTIAYSNYNEITPNLYVDSLFSYEDSMEIAQIVEEARERVITKYGETTSSPVIIVSSNDETSRKYIKLTSIDGRPVPGTTYNMPWREYILLSPEGNNVDVMSHELVHAEIFHRLGYIKSRKLPIWFNEGVALQVDNRKGKVWSYIQEERKLPLVSSLESASQFFSGDRALHYAAAKVKVSAWLASDHNIDLYKFLDEIKNGKNFHDLYENYEN